MRILKLMLSFMFLFGLMLPAFPQQADAHVYKNHTHKQYADYIIKTGLKYRGVPYRFGASMSIAPYRFDCSSFTKYVFAKAGIYLPRTSSAQSTYGKYVSRAHLNRGDLLFFHVPGRSVRVGHVGIYIGNGKMLHTYGAGGVKVSKISGYWERNYLGARRVF